MNDYTSLLTVVGLIGTILALILALWQTSDLKNIRESLSTRYLGGLTDYYPQLIEQIKSAKKSIEILCDFPAYGCFTHPDYWLAYHDELRNKRINKIHIHFKCQDEEFRNKADAEFFSQMKRDWSGWLVEPGNRAQLRKFLDCMSYENLNVDELTEPKFNELIKEADELTLKDCFAGKGTISEVKAIVRLDYWIIDKYKAIFAFTNYAHGSSRSGFFTTDQKLISALKDIGDSFPPTTE